MQPHTFMNLYAYPMDPNSPPDLVNNSIERYVMVTNGSVDRTWGTHRSRLHSLWCSPLRRLEKLLKKMEIFLIKSFLIYRPDQHERGASD